MELTAAQEVTCPRHGRFKFTSNLVEEESSTVVVIVLSRLTFARLPADILCAPHQTEFWRTPRILPQMVYLGHAATARAILFVIFRCLSYLAPFPWLWLRPSPAFQVDEQFSRRLSRMPGRRVWW